MMSYLITRKAAERGASWWKCALLSALMLLLGGHLAWLIRWDSRPVAAAVPPAMDVPPIVPPRPGVAVVDGVGEQPAAPQTPAETPPETASTPVYPPPPTSSMATEPGTAPSDDTGPVWTRKPLPLPSPSLLRRIANISPPDEPGRSGGLAPLRGYPVRRSGDDDPSPTTGDGGGPTINRRPTAEEDSSGSGGSTLNAQRPGLNPPAAALKPERPAPDAPPALAPLAVPPLRASGAPRPNARRGTREAGRARLNAAPSSPAAEVDESPAPAAPASPPAAPYAPLQASLWANRGKEARYRPNEWIVLRLAASAPCFAAVYRVGASGSVTQVLAPAEKPAGSFGFALKAAECGTGAEWAIAVTSTHPLSAAEIGAVLQAYQDSSAADEAIRAVRAYVQSPRDDEEHPSAPEAWQWAVAAVRYEVQ